MIQQLIYNSSDKLFSALSLLVSSRLTAAKFRVVETILHGV